MAKNKKGKGEGRDTSDKWGNGINWDTNDYMPAWSLDEKFTPNETVPFSTDIPAGQSGLYLPLFINNDNEQDLTGTDIMLLSLDSDVTSVGFSQETYVLKESWDNTPNSPGRSFDSLVLKKDQTGKYQLLRDDGTPLDLLKNMYLVDGNSRPNNTPKLVSGGRFQQAVVIIEDAGSPGASFPTPTQLSSKDDVRFGSKAIDIIYAGDGKDKIWGKADNDTLRGEAGNDLLNGGNGDDTILGEAGNDILIGGNSNTEVNPDSPSAADCLVGGSGDDILYGGNGVDVLYGMTNNDLLFGGSGADILSGGLGNDTLISGDGGLKEEYLFGGDGDDVLEGSDTKDVLSGDNGNDIIDAAAGDDLLDGGFGNDILDGGEGADFLNGYGTVLTSDPQIDTLIGGTEADTFILGGSWGVSYVEPQDGYAIIQDWEAGIDKIAVLQGANNQYTLEVKNVLGSTTPDTEIYHTDSAGNRDRIGIVQDKTISLSDLTPSNF